MLTLASFCIWTSVKIKYFINSFDSHTVLSNVEKNKKECSITVRCIGCGTPSSRICLGLMHFIYQTSV